MKYEIGDFDTLRHSHETPNGGYPDNVIDIEFALSAIKGLQSLETLDFHA